MSPPVPSEPKPRLSSEGNVYVTLAAAEQYQRSARGGLRLEEARRELTILMLDAYRIEGHPDRVRYRSRSDGLDITATARIDGRLVMITSCIARDVNTGDGDPDRPSQQRRRRLVR